MEIMRKRGCSGINVWWPVTSNEDFKQALQDAADGMSPNNISPVITCSLENGVKMAWFGDLETEFMEKIADEISWPEVDSHNFAQRRRSRSLHRCYPLHSCGRTEGLWPRIRPRSSRSTPWPPGYQRKPVLCRAVSHTPPTVAFFVEVASFARIPN